MRAWFLRSSLMQPLLCGRIVDDVACTRIATGVIWFMMLQGATGTTASMRVPGYVCLHRWFSHLSLAKEAGRGQPRSRTQGTKKHQFHCAPFGPRSNPSHAAAPGCPLRFSKDPASMRCNAWTSTPWPATDCLLTCGNTSLSSQRPECWGHWRKHLEGRKEGPPRCRKSKSSVSEKWCVMKLTP